MISYLSRFEDQIMDMLQNGWSRRKIAKELGVPKSSVIDFVKSKEEKTFVPVEDQKLKILIVDIETSPLLANLWSIWQHGVGLNQVQKDWHLMSFAAKWYGGSPDKVIYMDQSQEPNIEDDFYLCVALQDLLSQADAVLVQNGRRFDLKKINARCVINGLQPSRPVRIIDTLEIAKREFGFTSNKLQYMTEKLCKKYKKLDHGKFPGFELWAECIKGNQEAWAEMKEYNINDILSLEELYDIIKPYSSKHPNVALMFETDKPACRICGSTSMEQDGHWHTSLSKYDLYRCTDCGAYSRGRKTETTKHQRNNVTMSPIS